MKAHNQPWELQIVCRNIKLQNTERTWISIWKTSTSPCYHRPLFLQSTVTEQLTTCCCFYRQICHGDGCHPGRLPGASHPCGEDGRPLRARRASQTDVEAGGGGPAAGAGLNAEPSEETLPFLVVGRPALVMRVQLGVRYWSESWQMGGKKKLPHRTEQHILQRCQGPDREAWCKSDKDFDIRKQYLHWSVTLK